MAQPLPARAAWPNSPMPDSPTNGLEGAVTVQVTPLSASWHFKLYPATYSNALSGKGNLAKVTAPPGSYSIVFEPLVGYQEPLPQTQIVHPDKTTTFKGVYCPLGSLAIQVSPTTASWRLTSYPQAYTNATSASGNLNSTKAPIGLYTIAFNHLPGYRAPHAQTNLLRQGQLTKFSGHYIRNPVPLDFDGDLKTDVSVFDHNSGYWYILLSSNNQLVAGQFGYSGARPVPADYDGDGRADPAIHDYATGYWYIFLSSNNQLVAGQFGYSGARPVPADYDGDGRADPALFDYATGYWYIFLSSNGRLLYGQFSYGSARPVPGDYDGDGRADLACYDRNSGTWLIYSIATGKITIHKLGRNDARPVPADYDGDGRTDVAMYHRASGQWYILNTNGTLDSFQFGWSGGRAVPGDYDGDGCADAAVYHWPTASWFIRLSSSQKLLAGQFGLGASAALPSYANGGIEGLVMLAFGDSITYGSGSHAGGPASGYPALLERSLESAYGGHFITLNAGYPGETTEEALGRYEALLLATAPDLVLLMEGTNDEFYGDPYDQTEDNLRAMVAIAKHHGIQVVIATIPPVISSRQNRDEQHARIRQFNPRIHQIAADYAIPLAPVYESITAYPNWPRALMDQATGNHPNDTGYQVVRDAFYHAVINGINASLFY